MGDKEMVPLDKQIKYIEIEYSRLSDDIDSNLTRMFEMTGQLSDEHKTQSLKNLKNITKSAELLMEIIQTFETTKTNFDEIDKLSIKTKNLRNVCEQIAHKMNLKIK